MLQDKRIVSDVQGKFGISIYRILADPEPCDVRMALDMVERLQFDTQFSLVASQDDPELYDWNTTNQLLVTLIDTLNQNTAYTIQAAGGDFPDIPRMHSPLKAAQKRYKEEKAIEDKKPKTISEVTPEVLATDDDIYGFFNKSK